MKINKAFIHTIKGIAIGLVLVAGISYVQAAWAPPAGAPSEANNAPAPINVSSSNQSKEGMLSIGTSETGLVELEVTNSDETGAIWTDILQVWKTSQFLQKATFGSDVNNGKIDLVNGGALGHATLNVNYNSGEAPLIGQAINVDGSILATALENEGPGFDITEKGDSVNNVWATMLCADTNGKIVLCKDLDIPDGEVVEDVDPVNLSLSYGSVVNYCTYIEHFPTATVSGGTGTYSYSWSVTYEEDEANDPIVTVTSPYSNTSPKLRVFRNNADNLQTPYTINLTVTSGGESATDTLGSYNILAQDYYEGADGGPNPLACD
jgi:hypothetical protein